MYPPFSSPSTSLTLSSGKGKHRARLKSRENIIVTDTIQAIAFDEGSLRIERIKRLRESAINVIAATSGDDTHAETSCRGRERERDSNMVNGYHRRRSSVEATGVIAQPHNSVSHTRFYKYIDADFTDAERLRTLLIWCASRAAGKPSSLEPNEADSTNDKDNPDLPTNHDLPPLSERAQQTLKEFQDDVIRMLAEKRVDLRLPPQSGEGLKPNQQNVTNRMLEVRYTEQINRAREEEEAWKRVSYHYDAYIKQQKEALAKRKARLNTKVPPSTNNSLPEDMQRGMRLARALIATAQPKVPSGQSTTSPSQKRQRGRDTPLPTSTLPDGEQDLIGQALDEEVERRLLDMEFKVDYMLSSARVVCSMVNVAEELLNRWFELLNHNLASRINIPLGVSSSSSAGPANAASALPTSASDLGGFLNKYIPRQLPPGGFVITRAGSSARIPPSSGVDPRDLLRALSRVDCRGAEGSRGGAVGG
ncbi:hypothetical protein APHAL10511_001458 [Amanita phalloides]|nr:hypothetical protein APHAL10511_001458 [Amanita phalloides]